MFSGKAASEPQILWALRDVDLELLRGSSLGLVGSNGAGKTTILKLLANVTRPTSGQVEVNGRLSALIELGAGFHPELTGRENIFLNAAILGLQRREVHQKLDDIIAFAGLAPFIDTPVKRYSSGMIVRLGFAIASCLEPDVLLVDEVLAVGDAAFRQRCVERIRELRKNGTSLLFVSHDLYMVKAICDQAVYLKSGSVQCVGTPDEIVTRYERAVHMELSGATYDAQSPPETPPGEDISIEEVRVSGSSAPDGSSDLLSMRPARIDIRYKAETDLGKVNVSAFIRRSDGLTVSMLRTKTGHSPIDVPRGQGTIHIHLEKLQLVTGVYWVDAFFLNESDSISLTPSGKRSERFSVRGLGVSTAEDSGVFHPLAEWSVTETPSEVDSRLGARTGELQC